MKSGQKVTTILIIVSLSLALLACVSINNDKVSIKQGVSGKITWLAGNQMPSPDRPQNNLGKPIERKLYIYEVTNLTETEGQSPLFSKIKSKLVAKIKSNKDGYFNCRLNPGHYSIFTLEPNGKFFANLFDGKGQIAVMEVHQNKVTNYDIQINYEAAF